MIQPLAERFRPTGLEDFVGQEHLKDRIEAFLMAPRMPSLLLFGPPGCGKSTLALLLATHHSQHVIRLSAPEAGLAQLRKQIQGVEILVLDELHRFSKTQQDFLLPLLESGEITMIATTTENPSFSVTKQLLSRMHVLRLHPLNRENLIQIIQKASAEHDLNLDTDVMDFLATIAHGDARTLLNLIEYIMGLPAEKRTLTSISQSMPDIIGRHDKDGDSHYELASALIKSIRGSDPDAALYYLACLLSGGEDPRFICRRLILSASEDIGLGDPHALTLAVACQQSVEFVGMPEGFIPLAETVLYLALAPKNNASYTAYYNAFAEVKRNGTKPVPLHLRNASTQLQKEWGYGEGYKYPHNFPNARVEQQYLPNEVHGQKFYEPKGIGDEARLLEWWNKFPKNTKT